MNSKWTLILGAFLLCSSAAFSDDALYGESVRMPIGGTRGMVVADDQGAAEWGAAILRQGGNAVDAAVATAFAMSVTRPHFASIGGGGFMVYCPAPQKGRAGSC